MLKEILETRFMVKREIKGLKKSKESDVLGRVLEARQLAIKLLANVTCTCMYLQYALYCIERIRISQSLFTFVTSLLSSIFLLFLSDIYFYYSVNGSFTTVLTMFISIL